MGLLTNDAPEEDRRHLEIIVTGVLSDWDRTVAEKHGVFGSVSQSGISTACKLAEDHIFDGILAPLKPGPFKRAAAVAILSLYLERFIILARRNSDGAIEQLSEDDQHSWRSRFAFCLIAPTLAHLETVADGFHRMHEGWVPPSDHFQVELIAWMRALEPPFSHDGQGKRELDVARVTRAILALGLIVEACYYLIDGNLKGKGECGREASEKHRDDLDFDFYGTDVGVPTQIGEWHEQLA